MSGDKTTNEERAREWLKHTAENPYEYHRTTLATLLDDAEQRGGDAKHTVGYCGRYQDPDSCIGSSDCITEWCFGCLLEKLAEAGNVNVELWRALDETTGYIGDCALAGTVPVKHQERLASAWAVWNEHRALLRPAAAHCAGQDDPEAHRPDGAGTTCVDCERTLEPNTEGTS